MVALVAMTVVMKSHQFLVVFVVFLPTMTLLFLIEYFYPDLIIAYNSQKQRFFDVYTTFVISTYVISIILSLILKSYSNKKKRLDKAQTYCLKKKWKY